jgi:hypothetical protein
MFRYECYWCDYCKYMSEDSVYCEYFKKFVKPAIKCDYRKPKTKIAPPAAPM